MDIDPRAKEVGLIAFPEYRGRKFRLEYRDSVTLHGRYWSGGSKSDWMAVNLETRQAFAPEIGGFENPPQFGGLRSDPKIDIPPGVAIVEHVIFCGKDLGLRVYVRGNTPLPLGGDTKSLSGNCGADL